MKRVAIAALAGVLALTGLATAQAAKSPPPKKGAKKTTICHRTSSDKNPYVRITVSERALKAHMRHDGDIIPAPAGGCPKQALTAKHGGHKLSTTLTGAAEAPGPGDPDGSGSATIRLNHGQGQVCYSLTVSNIATATAAHIHRGAPGVAGPIVVTLDAPASGSSSGCVSADRALVKDILKNPADYYVNVHNAEFPGGAVRGQLAS